MAMIITPVGFRDEEFFVPYNYFKDKGYEVDVFSTKKGVAKGSLGAEFEVEKTIDEIDVEKYDAIVLVGGPGTPIVRKYEKIYDKITEADAKNKVVGAICWSPTILAKSGILKKKKATVWVGMDSEYGKTTDKVLEQYEAKYSGNEVEVDENIVTANGPRAALEYAKTIEKLILEKRKK